MTTSLRRALEKVLKRAQRKDQITLQTRVDQMMRSPRSLGVKNLEAKNQMVRSQMMTNQMVRNLVMMNHRNKMRRMKLDLN